jgi:hypothetical protein
MISQLVSGGQTGVDRAALDAALELGIDRRGWCPQGRIAEDGTIPDRYPLLETPSSDPRQRTQWNVRDADATLILSWGEPTNGTLLTVNESRRTGNPLLVIDLAREAETAAAVQEARSWIAANVAAGVLNVAGPRSSQHPLVYRQARAFLLEVLGGNGG